MEQVTATRSELLALRDQIGLASRGRDVLKEKRDQLMEEVRRTAESVLAGGGALESAAAEGRRILARAEAMDGDDAVASAALARPADIRLSSRMATVMGVRIADLTYEPLGRPRAGRGYTLVATSPHIDESAACFESELGLLLDLAISELRLRRLISEIKDTTRRVNALESIVIPRLEKDISSIQAVLDERERQDRFRLKRFSARRGSRIERGGSRD